jgi:hypothetical protein
MGRNELLKGAKPILFTTGMIRKIIAGGKTQTRRPISGVPDGYEFNAIREIGRKAGFFPPNSLANPFFAKLRYVHGDVLYVRETWQKFYHYAYKASPETYPTHHNGTPVQGIVWRPSIHMPRSAARIFLRVTDVRLERLQDITEADARAEGTSFPAWDRGKKSGQSTCRKGFAELWDGSYGKKDGKRWDDNPYVFVYEFEKIEVDNEL